MNKNYIRTDLAVESQVRNITPRQYGTNFDITEIIIDNDEIGKSIGKKKGRYVTLMADELSKFTENFKEMSIELAEEIQKFVKTDGLCLVVGLGNIEITPDALGPRVAQKVLATRHLKEELGEEDDFLTSLRPVSVLATGVLGQTGIETAEIVGAMCKTLKPSLVIVIDALACLDVERLGTTIQISDSGISPGSGAFNKRRELSEETLGVPVTAIGVPTIVSLQSLLKQTQHGDMLVTPRDIDKLILRASELIGLSINLALQETLSFEDAELLCE
ncbi:MAG: GPR endopeptidase [Ruminococcus sp.]|jgi:spore protease|nr:GPR endopeptidase [Ruminococcus sp.]